ncbi:MAG: hemolysin family protein [bacterium]
MIPYYMLSVIFFILLIIVLLFLSAFFSGSEIAIISANKIRLKSLADHDDKRAKIIIWFMEKPERLLGTILVGNNLVNVACTSIMALLINTFFQYIKNIEYNKWEGVLTTLIMTPIILIFGEIVPKSIGRDHANSVSLLVSKPMKLISIILFPLVRPLNKFISVFSKENIQDPERITEEIKSLANLSQKEGLLKPEQSEMIHSVFDLREQTIKKIMIPLVDVVSISKDASLEEFYEEITKTRFSRLPVYEGRTDNIIGIVHVSDVLYADTKSDNISSFVYENIIYLPETKHIYSSLYELQRSQHPMGIVVDEYGGVVGIITLEDIIAEIVGEIKDERDQDEETEEIFDGHTLECDGRTEIDRINQLFNLNISNDEYETIAGFVISQMDKIPSEGEEFVWKNLRIKVLKADKRSVLRVKITKEEEKENGETEVRNT